MAKQEVDPNHLKFRRAAAKRLFDEIRAHFGEAEPPTVTFDGNFKLPVWIKERNTYRNKSVMADWEFMLADFYISESDLEIFVFEPLESMEFTHVELRTAHIDDKIPLFGATFIKPILEKLGDRGAIANPEDAHAGVGNLMKVYTQELRDEHERKEKERRDRLAQSNPNFGVF